MFSFYLLFVILILFSIFSFFLFTQFFFLLTQEFNPCLSYFLLRVIFLNKYFIYICISPPIQSLLKSFLSSKIWLHHKDGSKSHVVLTQGKRRTKLKKRETRWRPGWGISTNHFQLAKRRYHPRHAREIYVWKLEGKSPIVRPINCFLIFHFVYYHQQQRSTILSSFVFSNSFFDMIYFIRVSVSFSAILYFWYLYKTTSFLW